jgi:hypothetical protein
MDIIYVLIGFVCGFICRHILVQYEVARAKARIEIYLKQLEENKHGDN